MLIGYPCGRQRSRVHSPPAVGQGIHLLSALYLSQDTSLPVAFELLIRRQSCKPAVSKHARMTSGLRRSRWIANPNS